MTTRAKWTVLLATGLMLVAGAAWAEREFRVLRGFEAQANYTDLPEWQPADFVVARLMYPSGGFGFGGFGRFGRGGGDWREGGTTWAVDYPKGDRYHASILKRLTTIDVRAVEQPVNLEDGDDVFYWPYLIVGLAGTWNLDDEMVDKLREYLERGGFLFCDSFFGSQQWEGFVEGMRRVFPDRDIVDLPDDHPLFHTVYDLSKRPQVPNMNSLLGGGGGYLDDGDTPHWRAILDDHGRVMVAIAFNNDVSDSFQWADDPDYPAESATLGLRMGVNFAVYALTH
ncbi:MAG TPA: DUF4159 domain-containing protein [Steroidobacteraceae bacterium]|nr:DUF4159 domain-containing protein [Steroidobacteraceae bacterium]